MFRVDPSLFRIDLMDDIDYHMACEEGFSPQEALKNAFQEELKEHALERAEIEEGLLQRIETVMAALTPMLQAMRQNDPNGPARVQLAHLAQSIQDLEEAKEASASTLLQAKDLLVEMKRQYSVLKEKFEQMQRMHSKAGEDQLTSFLRNEIGPRACRTFSHT